MSVFRIYVEKKAAYAAQADSMCADIRTSLQMEALHSLRFINRYDVQGLTEEQFALAVSNVFSEPSVDVTYSELPQLSKDDYMFAMEYLPGQFDQRADSCEQCLQLLLQGQRPVVRNARIVILTGEGLTDADVEKIKHYLINPVESREASLEPKKDLNIRYPSPEMVKTLTGFTKLDEAGLDQFVRQYGLAMDDDDIAFCQKYFRNVEKRDQTITEIRMIDTYWSDHCRHTTFLTQIDNVDIGDPEIEKMFQEYHLVREKLYQGRTDKPVTLMDMATIGAKWLKAQGRLNDLDESEEINACSVKIKVNVDGQEQDWLLMFKNETHNHPTEIEPFGGAATCLGGAIRDPLSGRSYVYQAMRVTGSGSPLTPVSETIAGKLPQKKITLGAAGGYSSYGNQIGLATGQVSEIYDEGYVAKRLEIGAVVGAAPAENVIRIAPKPGDRVILLGGKTGRDGCGGATGSSKSHTLESLESCGAEVQKGNAPEERKLQRLFRNPEVTRLIKRCNDFGAGGVSVAIGELADGLCIDLDKVPKKYDGLDGTELAISESQERMACVVAAEDVDAFIALAAKENLMAVEVAYVTEEPRLTMSWRDTVIVDLSREFLNSNGAPKLTDVEIPAVGAIKPEYDRRNTEEDWIDHLSDINLASQKGLSERFDSTIGAGTVLMPFGGENQLTPSQAMVGKIPVLHGTTNTCSLMAWGFNPAISKQSPYHAAMYAVIESVAKLVATGGDYHQCWLTFQEYFERTQGNPTRWGKPMAALLGSLKAQWALGIGSIGGKDSMSGTFEQIDVPPTLVSFAVSVAPEERIVSPEFKQASSTVAMILPKYHENGMPDFDSVKEVFDTVEHLIRNGYVNACSAITRGGVAEAIAKMTMGNHIGMILTAPPEDEILFNPVYGGFVLEMNNPDKVKPNMTVIGRTTSKYILAINAEHIIKMRDLQHAYESKLEPVFPYWSEQYNTHEVINTINRHLISQERIYAPVKIAKPRVLIPVFPGTNCEYDTARAFEQAGALTETFVINTLSPQAVVESAEKFAALLRQSQILMIPGGFSGGDEPDGSGKFICAFLKTPAIREAIAELLEKRDGLALGICNGFQALIKLGLVPYGKIVDMADNAPTLTFNKISRHQSMMVRTRICSNKSPWLYNTRVGDVYTVPISHGEGRFIADKAELRQLIENGQIATQYVDLCDHPTDDVRFNPNGSMMAVEGITSPDGRVLGKMAHSERIGTGIGKNVPGEKDQKIFLSGVEYFTK